MPAPAACRGQWPLCGHSLHGLASVQGQGVPAHLGTAGPSLYRHKEVTGVRPGLICCSVQGGSLPAPLPLPSSLPAPSSEVPTYGAILTITLLCPGFSWGLWGSDGG